MIGGVERRTYKDWRICLFLLSFFMNFWNLRRVPVVPNVSLLSAASAGLAVFFFSPKTVAAGAVTHPGQVRDGRKHT